MTRKIASHSNLKGRKAAPHSIKCRSLARPSLPPTSQLQTAGAAFAVLVLLRLIAGQFPEARLWGLSYPGYLATWTELLIVALGIIFATPLAYGLFRWMANLIDRPPALSLALATGVTAGVAFWLLRMDTYFFGDGASYLAEHFRWVHGLSISEDVLFSPGSAPLTAWLLATGAKLLYASGGALASQPQFVFQLSGAIAGAVFIFCVMYSSLRREEATSMSLTRIGLVIATPGLLFFFGYVEYYTLYFAALTIYFIATVSCAEGQLAPLWAVLAFIVSAAFHLMTLVTLPGLLIALAARSGAPLRQQVTLRNLLYVTAAVLVLGGIYYFASGIATSGSRVILALQPFGEEGAIQHYTLLSGAHLGDILNMVFLAAAPPLVLLAFVPWRGREWSPSELVTLAHVLYTGFLLLFGYTCFGMARDWDINAGFGVATSLFAVTLLSSRGSEPRRSYLGYLTTGGAIIAVLPWLMVNINADTSEQRFRDIMALDDTNITGDFALNGYEHLRKYYQNTGEPVKEAWANRKKVEMVGYPADFRKLLRTITLKVPANHQKDYMNFVFGQLEAKLMQTVTEDTTRIYAGTRNSFVEVAVEALLQITQLRGLSGIQDAYFNNKLNILTDILPNNPLLQMVKEDFRYERGATLKDGTAFLEAMPLVKTSSLIAFRMGRALIMTDNRPEARVMLNRAMEIDTAFTLPHFLLGYLHATATPPRPEQAIQHLETFIATPEGHAITNESVQARLLERARDIITNLTSRYGIQ